MNERLLDRFKKLPEQLKNMSNKELNETIDSARYIADEHGTVANRHEDQADKIEAERRQLEEQLRNLGIKQLSPEGLRLQRKIRELKKQEEEKRLLAEGYHDQEFYERTRASEAKVIQQKKYSHQEKPEYSKQMQQEYHDYLKYDTTAGRMITAREKMENETDPVKKAELKEIYEARAEEYQKYVDGLVYKDGVKPEKEPAITPEPQKIKPGDIVVTWNQEPKPETEAEKRKQVLLDLRDKNNESKPGRPKQLSLTPHMPPPNIQAESEKTTPEKVVEPKFANGIEKDMMGSKQEARQNLDKLSLKEIQVIGRGCFANLKDNGYQCKIETDPTKKAELVKERDSLNENWQGIKQGVFDAAEREYGQDRSRDRETDRDPDRGPEPTIK